jgi:hypothetical protein
MFLAKKGEVEVTLVFQKEVVRVKVGSFFQKERSQI